MQLLYSVTLNQHDAVAFEIVGDAHRQQFIVRATTPETLAHLRTQVLAPRTLTQHYCTSRLQRLVAVYRQYHQASGNYFVPPLMLYIQSEPVGRKAVNGKNGGDLVKMAPLTVKGYAQVIKGFFNWCLSEDLISHNPAARLKMPAVPDYMIPTFTSEHLKAMLDACDLSTRLGYRDYTLMLVLLETGIRVSELCGLCIQDVHDDYIRVVGKGSKEREVGISPVVGKLLWKYIHQYRKPADEKDMHVFVNRYGQPLTPNGVEQLLIDVKHRAGIEGVRVSAHTFRHTFARMYLEKGGEIYKLSRLMGHSSVEVAEQYLKDFRIREARQEQDKFSPVGSLNLLKKKKGKKKQG